jgi:translation initiation factor IF-2
MFMSNVRIYEIAKELGLENKEVIALCRDLGIEGKKSHSNSLTAGEADKIRRSVIRQAVAMKQQDSVREIEMSGGLGTERRKGNVIRRRKKDVDEDAELEAEKHKNIDISNAPVKTVEFVTDSTNILGGANQRAQALAEADAIFGNVSESTSQDEQLVENTLSQVQEVNQVEPSKVDSQEEEILEQIEEVSGGEDSLASARKRHDIRAAKVLGKIELPVREVAPKPSEDKIDVELVSEDEDEEAKPTKATKRRKTNRRDFDDDDSPRRAKKRKQVLKKDELLDYGGNRDYWKQKKDRQGKKPKERKAETIEQSTIAPTKASKLVLKISNEISVGELARMMSQKVGDIISYLMSLGVMATINEIIDFDTATIVGEHFGFTTINIGHDETEFIASIKEVDRPEDLVTRPPVVTVMGHVDHGKTSLLDAIRETSVMSQEAGGITQHIGAYNVKVPNGSSVTFLDTPGHEAFTEMRSRGVQVTDVVVLVVAADDGVMPQTIEAINHARVAKVPIVVAVNKIDKEGANPDKVINQLSEHGLIPESWGGDTIFVRVSAQTKEGISELLENLILQSDVLELKANPTRPAFGTVIESKLDRGRGPVMTVLIQNGTLKKGDIFLSGSVTGKIKALISHDGRKILEVGPGMPVEVLGASDTPSAGDDFLVLSSEAEARKVSEIRSQRKRVKELAAKQGFGRGMPLTLENFSQMVSEGDLKELPIIVKADVQGSVEAITQALNNLSNNEVNVKLVHQGVGAVTENDVQLAVASNAIVVGFNVRPNSRAAHLIDSEKVDFRYSRVIYELIEAIEKAMKGLLDPIFKEKTLGRVEVRQTFRVPKLGTVAGSYVTEGVVNRGALVRLLRDDIVVYEGKLASLRRFKDDVKEVAAGYECGLGIEGYSDIRDGDVIEVYKIEEVAR